LLYQRFCNEGKEQPHMIRVMVFNVTFNNISVICFLIGGGNRSTQRKPPTCCKLLTIFIAVIGTYCVCSCKSSYHKHTNTMARIFLYSLVSIHAVYTHILIDFWVTNISWLCNKWKKQNILHSRNKSKIKYQYRERRKIESSSTQIHDCSLSWLGTGILIMVVS
jgi:hypothetical protein